MRILRSGGRSSERPDWSGTSIGNRGIMPDGRARLGLRRGRFGLCGGRRARPGQRPGAEQGAADDRAAGEDAGGLPERGVVAVRQRQRGQGLAADQPGRGQVGGEVGGDGGGEDGVQQRRADRGAELLADGDGGGGDASVLPGHPERAGAGRRRDHHAHAEASQDDRAEHARGVPGMRPELSQPDRRAGLGQHPGCDHRPGPDPGYYDDGVFNPAGAPSFRGEHLGDPVVALATMAPDIHRELQRFHVVGDVVAVEPAIQGTFTGPFNWPGGVIHPTGAKLDVPCADFWYIETGKIKEFNCHVSMDVMFRQMGGKLVFASDGAESSAAAS